MPNDDPGLIGGNHYPTLTPEQVAALPIRIVGILDSLQRGYGTFSMNGPDEGSVAYGQMMLGELLKDLDLDMSGHMEVVNDRWLFDDLEGYALLPIDALASAPNLTHQQKVDILAQYPDFLGQSRFAWTRIGAKSMVHKKLEALKRGSLEAQQQQTMLTRDVEHRWRHDRRQRVIGGIGSLVRKVR